MDQVFTGASDGRDESIILFPKVTLVNPKVYAPSGETQVDLLTFQVKNEVQKHKSDIATSWLLLPVSSPLLAKGFFQIILDGVEEVCGIHIVLVQLHTEN